MSSSAIKFASTHIEAPAVEDLQQVSNYDEISEILRSQKFVQGAFRESGENLLAKTLIVLEGPQHLQRRQILSRMFSERSVKELREQYLRPTVDHGLAELAASAPGPDGKIAAELVSFTQRCVYRIAGAVAGIDGLDNRDVADRFIEKVQLIGAAATVEWSRDTMSEVLRAGLAAQESVKELFAPSYERRVRLVQQAKAGELDPAQLPFDVLTHAIQHRDEAWAGDQDLLLREVSLFLVAASQTTAGGLISFILRLEAWLAEHPEDRRLIAEDPDFLRRAALESLRLTVAAPARIREAAEDVELKSGRKIRKGERVALLFIPANMETARFGDDAARYNPHRVVAGTPHWGLSFGAGTHSCPGRPLVTGSPNMKANSAVDGSMVTIARRLYEAGFELDPDNPPVPDKTTHYDLYVCVPMKFSRLAAIGAQAVGKSE